MRCDPPVFARLGKHSRCLTFEFESVMDDHGSRASPKEIRPVLADTLLLASIECNADRHSDIPGISALVAGDLM